MAKFEIRRTTNSQYYWRLIADNGEVLCNSETFVAKTGAQNGIAAVKRVAPTATVSDLT